MTLEEKLNGIKKALEEGYADIGNLMEWNLGPNDLTQAYEMCQLRRLATKNAIWSSMEREAARMIKRVATRSQHSNKEGTTI